jgi:hypothetical protein
MPSGGCSSIEFILALKKLNKLGVSNSGMTMRRTVLMVAALAFTAAPPHVEAQIRSARPCNTNQCLLKQIDALEAQVTDLKKQMDDLNANALKSGQTINIDDLKKQVDDLNANALKSGQTVNITSPDGCLSYGDIATMRTGPVWWSNPCQRGAWTIQQTSSP